MFPSISKHPIAAAFSSKLEQLKGKETLPHSHSHTDKPTTKPTFEGDTLALSSKPKPKPMHGAPINDKVVEKGGADVKQELMGMKSDLEGIDQAIDELDEKFAGEKVSGDKVNDQKIADEKNCERPYEDEKPGEKPGEKLGEKPGEKPVNHEAGHEDVHQQEGDAKLEALDEKLPSDHGGENEPAAA